MFVKIFAQILDSSIAEDYQVRLVFEDLLKLANKDGLVDMTLGAISRRTHVPLEIVAHGIEKLSLPDPESRSPDEEGRRIVLIDSHRSWGWRIVNYLHYRNIRDEEARKTYFREQKREQRKRTSAAGKETQELSKTVKDIPRQSNNVRIGPLLSTEEEAEALKQSISDANASSPSRIAPGSVRGIIPERFVKEWNARRGSLPKVEKFTTDRRKKVKARINAGLTVDRFIQAIDNCLAKPFLRGENDRGWTADFDWLIENSTNIQKAIEKPYGLNSPAAVVGQKLTTPDWDAFLANGGTDDDESGDAGTLRTKLQ